MLSLVGGPLSGNGCGSPNITHIIFVISFLLVALLTQFILDKLNTGLLNQVKLNHILLA